MHGGSTKATHVLREEAEYLLLKCIFGSMFFQVCRLSATIHFRKVKHHNKTSTKLLAPKIHAL